MPVLTVIDARRIQNFVFASNRLIDAIGASELIKQHFAASRLRPLVRGSQGTLILSAGGNLWATFPDRESAKGFAAAFSRHTMEAAPGLELAAVHVAYEAGELAQALAEAPRQLARAKSAAPLPASLGGLSVTATCSETNYPAVKMAPGRDREPVPLSAMMLCRRAMDTDALEHVPPSLAERFRVTVGGQWRPVFPRDLDELGRTHGDTSQIAVVYLDGNGIGQRLTDWQADHQNDGDEAITSGFQRISEGIEAAVEKAFTAALERMADALCTDSSGDGAGIQSLIQEQSFPLHRLRSGHENRVALPMRLLVKGGDDLTFVCDARIGLELAAAALHAFSSVEVPEIGVLDACGGVFICGSHFPISEALEGAHAACRQAKQQRRVHGGAGARMSWLFEGESPEDKRRTYRVGSHAGSSRMDDWEWLSQDLLGTGGKGLNGEVWRASRNKAKQLRQLTGDADVLESTLAAWRIGNNQLALPDGVMSDSKGLTALADALELLDLYWPLPGRNE